MLADVRVRDAPPRLTSHVQVAGVYESVTAQPSPDLAAVVRGYSGYAEFTARPIVRRELPSAEPALIINFGPRWQVRDALAPSQWESRDSFVTSLHLHPALVASNACVSCLEVGFTPVGAARVLDVPLARIPALTTSTDALFGAPFALLVERLALSTTWTARFAIVEAFIRMRVARARALPREVVAGVALLEASRGARPIAAIARQLGRSREHFSRQFAQAFSLAPRDLARVLRFQHAVQRATACAAADWAGIAASCGYADQAHLGREFRALGGLTPRTLHARLRNPELGLIEPG